MAARLPSSVTTSARGGDVWWCADCGLCLSDSLLYIQKQRLTVWRSWLPYNSCSTFLANHSRAGDWCPQRSCVKRTRISLYSYGPPFKIVDVVKYKVYCLLTFASKKTKYHNNLFKKLKPYLTNFTEVQGYIDVSSTTLGEIQRDRLAAARCWRRRRRRAAAVAA